MKDFDFIAIRRCLWLGLLASVVVLAVTLTFPNLFTDWELKTFDHRMKGRGEIKTDPHIVLIDIDDRSIESIGRWPWDRSFHARMINILSLRRAHTIAYDILFNQPSEKKNDDLLAKATAESARVCYPVGFDFTPCDPAGDLTGTKGSEEVLFACLKPYGFGRFVGNLEGILSVKRAIAPIGQVSAASKGLGHISSNRDGDGIIRRVPLIVEMDDVLFPSFALRAVMDYLDVPKENIIIKSGKSITLKRALFPGEKRRRDVVIPIDNKGMMLINYAGEWARIFHHYSFKNIIEISNAPNHAPYHAPDQAHDHAPYHELDHEPDHEPDHGIELPDFEGKIIIVSNTASGYDIKPIPIETNYPGGGIHANIINTILTENFLREASPYARIVIILILGIIGAFSGLFIKWHLKLISLFLLLSGYLVLNFYLFKSSGMVLQVLSPSISLILGSMLVSFYQIQSERSATLSLSKEKKSLEMEKKGLEQDKKSLEQEKRGLEQELELVSNRLTEKEVEITGIRLELSNQEQHISLKLKEKLRTEKDEKESLEKKKIMILRQLSPFESDELQKEAARFHIITRNRKLLEAFDLARKVAPTDHGVLLLGESGTGKELFARAIHATSKRSQRELVTVNVASIVPTLAESELFGHVRGAFAGAEKNRDGLFQRADQGTIFLDEIGDLHFEIQAKLLRVLQDGEIRAVGSSTSVYTDVRVIAATDKNLELEVRSGRFNKALFSRLNRYPIILPPLRERIEDIPFIVEEFIKRHKEEREISGICAEAIEALVQYHWPENVRQLENVVIRSLVNTRNKELQSDDIQYALKQELYPGYEGEEEKENEKGEGEKKRDAGNDEIDCKDKKDSIQKGNENHGELIKQLRATRFSIQESARILNISRNTLTDHFKGICFQYIVEHGGDIESAVLAIAGDPDITDKVERKVKRYYENLISNIEDCENAKTAKNKCSKIFKNIPREYYHFVEIMIDHHFKLLNQ